MIVTLPGLSGAAALSVDPEVRAKKARALKKKLREVDGLEEKCVTDFVIVVCFGCCFVCLIICLFVCLFVCSLFCLRVCSLFCLFCAFVVLYVYCPLLFVVVHCGV